MAKKDKPNPRAASITDQQIGASIRARRLAIGMSQERMGELIGVTFQQVQKYEKGVNRVSASTLLAIAATLQTTADELLPSNKNSGANAAGDGEAEALMRLHARLNADGRRMLMKLARSLAADDDTRLKDRR